MKVENIQKLFSQPVFDRGEKYYLDGRISRLDKISVGKWLAEVEGTHTYVVNLYFIGDNLESRKCNCPIGALGACKHVAAVLLAMKDEIPESKPKSEAKEATLTEILKQATKEQLEKFVLQLVETEPGLKDQADIFFMPPTKDPVKKYKKLITSIYSRAKGSDGFIEYSKTYKLVNPIMELLEKGHQFVEEGEWDHAMAIAKAVAERLPDFALNMDDSDGDIRMMEDEARNLFLNGAIDGPKEVKHQLFAYANKEVGKEKYKDFDFDDLFMDILGSSSQGEQVDIVLEKIDNQISSYELDPHGHYSIVSLIIRKIEILENIGRLEEASLLMEANIEDDQIRKLLVDRCISSGDFERAKELSFEAIEGKTSGQLFRSETLWKAKMLEIAQQENSISDIRKWAEELYYEEGFEIEYYRILKPTFTDDAWPEQMELILRKVALECGGRDEIYKMIVGDIFVEEKKFDRLLSILQESLCEYFTINKFAKHLSDTYPDRVLSLYKPGLMKLAVETGRNKYKHLARELKKLKKIKGGETFVNTIVEVLIKKYSNRPAMIQELNKI